MSLTLFQHECRMIQSVINVIPLQGSTSSAMDSEQISFGPSHSRCGPQPDSPDRFVLMSR